MGEEEVELVEYAPVTKTTIMVDQDSVVINPDNMGFNEVSLSQYLQREYSWVDYFGRILARLEQISLDLEVDYDAIYGQTYDTHKTAGGTEKQAEARAKCDPAVIAAKKAVNAAKKDQKMVALHLKSWDKNHDNAQSLGHFLRKSMDKLHNDILSEQETDYQKLMNGT